MRKHIYLDYNATAPMLDSVRAAIIATLDAQGNPSSVHQFGQAQRIRVEQAREHVAALVGANSKQVIFTSGGTEANNLALSGVSTNTIIVSAIEHDSVLNCRRDVLVAPVESSGVIDLVKLEKLIGDAPSPVLVSLMLANNETGVIQPVAGAAEIVHKNGGILHCDAVQAAGRVPVDIKSLGVDMMTLSAHKIGGPQGTGALIYKDNIALKTQLRGGGQERGFRAGTENVIGIIGFGEAALVAREKLADWKQILHMRDRFEHRITDCFGDDIKIFGQKEMRLANTTCIGLSGVSAETQVIALDLAGIAVSAGSACSSGKVKSSHVLEAMGVEETLARSAIRVSLCPTTIDAELDQFLEFYKSLRNRGVVYVA